MTSPGDAVGTSNPSGPPEPLNHARRPINMVAGTIGHFVEWYDWYIYGLLAAVFSSQIFPSHSAFASLIVVARIIQGISAGSEGQSAIAFMVEHAPPNKRGLYGSFTNMASGLATLAATGAAAIVTATLSKE